MKNQWISRGQLFCKNNYCFKLRKSSILLEISGNSSDPDIKAIFTVYREVLGMKTLQMLSLLLVGWVFLGCQTNQLKQYEQVKVGMDKGQVLELMGSPQKTSRLKGQDRWTYVFYEKGSEYQKEMLFDAGKSTYVGDIQAVQVSADEQDKKNEESNLAIFAHQQKIREENRQVNFGDYESQVKGTDQIRYVPQFKPIE